MAFGDPYASLQDLKGYLDIDADKVAQDANLSAALLAASDEIEKFCDRQFNKGTVATVRYFEPASCSRVDVDDFHTTTDLTVELYSGSNLYGTPITSTGYELQPVNGVVGGQSGWPYSEIHVHAAHLSRSWDRSATVKVTAQWGWAAVPSAVKQATLILASQLHKLADAPFGVAGMSEFGVVRVRDIPAVSALLAKYRRDPYQVG